MGSYNVVITTKEAGADQSITVDFNLIWAVFDQDDTMIAVEGSCSYDLSAPWEEKLRQL